MYSCLTPFNQFISILTVFNFSNQKMLNASCICMPPNVDVKFRNSHFAFLFLTPLVLKPKDNEVLISSFLCLSL